MNGQKKEEKMEGWICLHRKLFDSDFWKCEPFSRGQAWVDLLLLANHKDSFFYKRGVKVEVKRGQLARSEVELSDRWKWSRTKVRKFLNDLKKEQQINVSKSFVTQVVTINNYSKYQEKEQQPRQQKYSRSTTEVQQKDTYNNENNENNENKKEKRVKFSPPTVDEVESYFIEKGLLNGKAKKEASKFYNYYGSVGWIVSNKKPMRNWKLSASGWIERMNDFTPKNQEPEYSSPPLFTGR